MPEPKPLGEIAKDLLFELLPMDSDEKWEALAAAVVKAHEERREADSELATCNVGHWIFSGDPCAQCRADQIGIRRPLPEAPNA